MAEQAVLIDPSKSSARNLAFLKAGAPITIDISTPAGQKRKFNTFFIGYLPKKYVLIEFPETTKLGNFSQYIGQGTVITVRGLIEGRDGAAVAFISSVRQTLQIPSRIMVLDIPTSVKLQQLRSSVRIDTRILAKVRIDDVYWQTTMTNISVDGGQLDIINGEKLVLAEDKIVDIEHAYRMKLMLDKYNKSYKWFIDEEGEHSFGSLEQKQTFFIQLSDFLKKHLI